MKTAEAPLLKMNSAFPPMDELEKAMDNLQHHKIDTLNWKDQVYRPEVSFSIAYSSHEIFIKYFVKEIYFKAEKTEPNQNVYEDSCVEFFVSPVDDGLYYNMEFNAIGTCLLGSGTGRKDSKRTDPKIISKIRRLASSGNKPLKEREGEYAWTITIAIPFEVFFHHNIEELTGKTFRANFYKCGDKLKVPHYLTWNPVGTEKPDFHRPEYFGFLKFL
jgi:hypothetical protein